MVIGDRGAKIENVGFGSNLVYRHFCMFGDNGEYIDGGSNHGVLSLQNFDASLC